jgi:hypothetical protein
MTISINPTSMAEYVNAEFDVLDDPSNSLHLKLTGIVEHVKNERQETFSIFFHGPSTMFMQQGLRRLKNESLGEVSMFLVPVGQDADGFQYEAVFNHMIR